MEWISDPQIWIGLLTLTALEIVLGIDNTCWRLPSGGNAFPERSSPPKFSGGLLQLCFWLKVNAGNLQSPNSIGDMPFKFVAYTIAQHGGA